MLLSWIKTHSFSIKVPPHIFKALWTKSVLRIPFFELEMTHVTFLCLNGHADAFIWETHSCTLLAHTSSMILDHQAPSYSYCVSEHFDCPILSRAISLGSFGIISFMHLNLSTFLDGSMLLCAYPSWLYMPYCSYRFLVDETEPLLIVVYLSVFICLYNNKVITYYGIFGLCYLISTIVALCWLLLSYSNCPCLIWLLSPIQAIIVFDRLLPYLMYYHVIYRPWSFLVDFIALMPLSWPQTS